MAGMRNQDHPRLSLGDKECLEVAYGLYVCIFHGKTAGVDVLDLLRRRFLHIPVGEKREIKKEKNFFFFPN